MDLKASKETQHSDFQSSNFHCLMDKSAKLVNANEDKCYSAHSFKTLEITQKVITNKHKHTVGCFSKKRKVQSVYLCEGEEHQITRHTRVLRTPETACLEITGGTAEQSLT